MTIAGTTKDDSSFGLTPFDLVFAAALPRAKPPSGLVQLWEQGFAGQALGLVPLTPTLTTLPVWTEGLCFCPCRLLSMVPMALLFCIIFPKKTETVSW
jgi:hypothetical protein